MADISKLRTAVVEKQELILNKLTTLSYEEVMHLMASLSSIITNLDNVQAEEEVLCNRLMVSEMERDQRTTFSKAEAILKASDTHHVYKNILSLKQCAVRGLGLARLHAHHLLNVKVGDDTAGGVEV
jgi:hypothetical protein